MSQKRRRSSLRYQGWNYRAVGYYFITICTHQKACLFDSAEFKQIVERAWQRIPSYKSVTVVRLDAWVVMPNHIHGILVIVEGVSAEDDPDDRAVSGSVGRLIGTFKMAVAKRINHQREMPSATVWQRGYYDRVIRNERELNAIRIYIENNPQCWKDDPDNLDDVIKEMTQHP